MLRQRGPIDSLSAFLHLSALQLAAHEHRGPQANGIERRAQLVAHGGNKLVLGPVGAFREEARLLRRLQRLLQARIESLALGLVAHDLDESHPGAVRVLRDRHGAACPEACAILA